MCKLLFAMGMRISAASWMFRDVFISSAVLFVAVAVHATICACHASFATPNLVKDGLHASEGAPQNLYMYNAQHDWHQQFQQHQPSIEENIPNNFSTPTMPNLSQKHKTVHDYRNDGAHT
jgi:hypothetical protein